MKTIGRTRGRRRQPLTGIRHPCCSLVEAMLRTFHLPFDREARPLLRHATDDADDQRRHRLFNQQSRFGAIIDPIADKALLLTAIITLSIVDWGPDGWRLPLWFTALVVFRDCVILGGIGYLHFTHHEIKIAPHWSGKICTVTQMIAIGWVMLKIIPVTPLYPALLAAVFTLWSGIAYFRTGLKILAESGHARP